MLAAVLRTNPVLAIVMNILMFMRTFAVVCALVAAGGAALAADERSDARAQVEFGIEVVHSGLWQEAIYRWERAVEIDRSYAAPWNNLGIAYEHEGMFDKARDAYERAMDLDPDNMLIQQNYDLFREINDLLNERDP